MYILELITKLLKNRNKPKGGNSGVDKSEYEICNHVFLPIDSTGETLACTKCGFVVNKEKMIVKPQNPFIK